MSHVTHMNELWHRRECKWNRRQRFALSSARSWWGHHYSNQWQRFRCVAVCCSVLQCAAVCCSVLQCAAVCCSVLQCAAECCSVLQCVVVYCNAVIIRISGNDPGVLQCGAVCCSVAQCGAVWCNVLQCAAVYRSVLQCDAVWCRAVQYSTVLSLQHAPIHCNMLQHTATLHVYIHNMDR